MRHTLIRLCRKLRLVRLATFVLSRLLSAYKLMYRIAGKSDIDAVYSKSYFRHIRKLTQSSASATVETILKSFSPESVIDFGCGPGVYLQHFKKRGIGVKGIDGSHAAIENTLLEPSEVELFDLRRRYISNIKYDLCICFEVAEHLPKSASSFLVASLTGASDTVVFTSAPPGQGGTDHINEQPKDFWISLFEECGFYYDASTTAKLAEGLKRNNVLWYLPDNISVFRRKDGD